MEKDTGNIKAHTTYKDKGGGRVPSVTTILDVLAKPALIPWANRLGLRGIDSSKYVDEKAAIGTLAHKMICGFLTGSMIVEPTPFTIEDVSFDFPDYTANQMEMAHLCFEKFREWYSENDIEFILSEAVFVSEEYKYGGTIDFYCKLNGKYALVDFKTSKAVYSEHFIQLAAYEQLLVENGREVDGCRILRIGRDEDEGFEELVRNDLTNQFLMFYYCREIYRLKNLKGV